MRRRSRLGVAPTILITFLVVIIFAAIAGPLIAPHDPELVSLPDRFRPPSWVAGGTLTNLLGTDNLGRDVLSRLIVGARASIAVAAVTVLVAGTVGSALGIIAGFYGGKIDAVIMRLVDAMFAFPVLFLALLLAITMGPGLGNLLMIIPVILWSRFARLVRGEVLSLRSRDYILAARTVGARATRLMFRHLLPNVANTIVVVATLQVGSIILFESSLSFLGVGVPPPTPDWGAMLAAGRSDLATAWWVSVFPGLAILLTVLTVNILGDMLRDATDPRLRTL